MLQNPSFVTNGSTLLVDCLECSTADDMVSMVPSLINVLVIAHPDDESMFFLPWIYYTARHRTRDPPISSVVWLLCLTTGNYDGLGTIRSQELHNFNRDVLHDNGFQKVIILDEPDIIPDHPKQRWNVSEAAQQIHSTLRISLDEEYGHNRPSTMSFVTFDQRGVSGHVNHIDTYYAVQHLFHQQLQLLRQQSSSSTASNQSSSLLANESVAVWVLETIKNPICKYVPVGEWIRLLLHFILGWYPDSDVTTALHQHPTESTYRLLQPLFNWSAMSTHQSQFVWYRRLFVIFSIYTYKNTFRSISALQSGYVTGCPSDDDEGLLINTTPLPNSQQLDDTTRSKKEL